ncbi:Anti-repressor protein [Imhoffiella purpurea]|uniref:Anti-repressor protein n=2 Tax=Imhoffiella purpurea TaxID=1249627 RepID=W9V979_9GAMM|nr:Anti-repressor protein [Imhoffiella purpurea]
MSSVEIAELTGKRHDNVVRDLKELGEQGVIDLLSFEGIYRDSMNREQTCYHLPKRETLILTSGYSAQQRAAIIDRWLALEEQVKQSDTPQLPNFTDPAAAAEAWAKEYRDKMVMIDFAKKQAAQLTEQAPMVDFAEAVVADSEDCYIRDAAKSLDVAPLRLYAILRKYKWINESNEPYQDKINAGYLKRKVGYGKGKASSKKTITTLVTPKGLARIHKGLVRTGWLDASTSPSF